ncbi:MAG: amidohydrolase family protein [Pseudomonadota bacterium]
MPRSMQHCLTVDLHCHALNLEVEQIVASHPEKLAEAARTTQALGIASADHNRTVMAPQVFPKLTDIRQRIEDMDEMGVDVQVVSPAPNQYYYWADETLARTLVSLQNRAISDLSRRFPERILGLGNVSLQHPLLAVEQLKEAVIDLGLKGVEISSTINGVELADARFDPFWQAAEELGCIVFLHPLGTSAHERLNRSYLTNVIGQPLETTIALSHLIFEGVLDRFPLLKIVAAHGGGYFPAYFSRAEHAFKVRPEAARMKHAPREYLKRIWFDTVVYEPEMLRHLISVVGLSQIVVGTDYPYDMGSYDVHGLIHSLQELSAGDRARILGGNAAALLNIERHQSSAAIF